MALGKRNAPEMGNGITPQPPSASPEKLDAFLDAVGTRLNQLQATVADLVERTAMTEGARPAMPGGLGTMAPPAIRPSGDSDVDAASRTLVLAQRTADTLLGEAREEAEKLTADARVRCDAMLAEAKAAADAELGTQRAILEAEQAKWNALKVELAKSFAELEGQFDGYVTNLTTAHTSIREVLKGFDISAETLQTMTAVEPEEAVIDVTEAEPELEVEHAAPELVDAPPPPPEPVEAGGSMFGPRSTPLFSGQSTGWNNEGGEAAAPPMPEPPPAPSRRPGFFGQ